MTERPDTIQVREHRCLDVGAADGLSEAQVDFLCDLRARSGVRFFEEVREGRMWQLRFRHYVGAVALPGGQTLEILPKIGRTEDPQSVRANLMNMLAATGLFPSVEGALGSYASCDNLIEAYLLLACRMAWALVHGGLPRDYHRVQLTTPFLKGRWNVARQITRHAGRLDRHDVSIHVLTEDTPHGRFLKAGMARILRVARGQESQRLARSLLFLLDPLEKMELTWKNFQRLPFDRRHTRWRALLTLLAQLGRGTMSEAAQGREVLGPAWLFDMNRLFEGYVAQRLRLVHDGPVTTQRARRHLLRTAAGQGRFSLKPDIIVGEPPTLIIDTKWKHLDEKRLEDAVADEDARQVFAYGKIYRAPRVALVYPSAGVSPRDHELRSNEAEGHLRVTLFEVPVGLGQDEALDERLRRLVLTADHDPGSDEALCPSPDRFRRQLLRSHR